MSETILFTVRYLTPDGHPTSVTVSKEHTGSEMTELRAEVLANGITQTTGPTQGRWIPPHRVTAIDWAH